jgi:hypothetical protein
LTRPGHLLGGVDAGLGRAEAEPDGAAAVPCLDVGAGRHFGQVVLCGTRVVDLLRGDVVDGCARGDGHDVGGIAGRVAADIAGGGVLDALLGVGVFGLAGRGPVLFFGFAVYDEAGEGVLGVLVDVVGRGGLTCNELVPLWQAAGC